MTSNPSDLYPVIAQIAATFAGFGSLASGIGHRQGGADPRMDAYRLSLMLFASLSATMLGLLPAMLGALSLAAAPALRVSAAIAVVPLAINAYLSSKRVLKLRHAAGFNFPAGVANTACALTALAAFAVCALGTSVERMAGTYMLGLMGLLGSSMIMFSRVIVSMLGAHVAGGGGSE